MSDNNYMDQFNEIYEQSQSSGGENFPDYQKRDHQAKHTVVRLIGPPRQVRRAWIKCDNDKNIPFIYSKNSVLQKIVNTVLDYSWVNVGDEKDEKWEKKYKYQEKYGPVFWMVKQNSSDDARDAGWEGQLFYPFNCIDRMDNWCIENKHTKLIVKSVYDIGMSAQAFKSFKNNVIEDYGPYEDYDIDIKKITDEKGSVSYVTQKAQKDIPEIAHLIFVGPLSEEEKAYEKYNLDDLTKDSSAKMILKFLQTKIAVIDATCKTNFVHELQEQAKNEPDSQTNSKSTSTGDNMKKFIDSGQKTSEGFSYADLKNAGWTDEQLFASPNYKMVVKEVIQPAPTPEVPPPTPATPPPTAPPSAPATPPTPLPEKEVIKVDGFSYEDMKKAGWSDPQLLADPKWSVLVPQQEKPSTPATPPPAAPPAAPPSAPAAPAAPPAAPPSSNQVDMLPCTRCKTPFPITEQKCPSCGYEEGLTV